MNPFILPSELNMLCWNYTCMNRIAFCSFVLLWLCSWLIDVTKCVSSQDVVMYSIIFSSDFWNVKELVVEFIYSFYRAGFIWDWSFPFLSGLALQFPGHSAFSMRRYYAPCSSPFLAYIHHDFHVAFIHFATIIWPQIKSEEAGSHTSLYDSCTTN